MIEHTPGPWKWAEQGEANEYVIYNAPAHWLIAFRHNGEPLVSKARANVRLMAASPHLFDACRLALELIKDNWIADHGSEQVGNAWGALEAAIESATGEPA